MRTVRPMVHTNVGYGKCPECGLLHGRSPILLLGSCDSARAERQGRHPLEAKGSGEGQCLEQDDHGQKAKRHERILCFPETASSPQSGPVQLEGYMK